MFGIGIVELVLVGIVFLLVVGIPLGVIVYLSGQKKGP